MPHQNSSILLIEDDSNDVLLLKRALTKCGITDGVQVLQDGEEAIAFLSGEEKYADRSIYPLPGFIITDLKMPRAGGFDILTWIKEHSGEPMAPVIVLTSSRDHNDVRRAYALGAHSYIVKPTSFEELQRAMKTLFEYWRMCERPEMDVP